MNDKCLVPNCLDVNQGAGVGDSYALSVAPVLLQVLKTSRRPWKYARVARELNAMGTKTASGEPMYGKAVMRLMMKLPTVVEEAKAFRDARDAAAWKKFFGSEMPTSMNEALTTIPKKSC